MVKPRVIRLRGAECQEGAWSIFLCIPFILSGDPYMRRMRNNNLEIMIMGSSCLPQKPGPQHNVSFRLWPRKIKHTGSVSKLLLSYKLNTHFFKTLLFKVIDLQQALNKSLFLLFYEKMFCLMRRNAFWNISWVFLFVLGKVDRSGSLLIKKNPYEYICIFIGVNSLAPPALKGKI